MAIFNEQLREYVIQPVLQKTGLYSLAAEQLILGTCAVETNMGSYLRQMSGPALGIYQMEPLTANDIWLNFIDKNRKLRSLIFEATEYIQRPNNLALMTNLAYATIMCRVHYLRVSEKLPEVGDFTAMANYWKKWYNTPLGRGTTDKFLIAYQKHVLPMYQKRGK